MCFKLTFAEVYEIKEVDVQKERLRAIQLQPTLVRRCRVGAPFKVVERNESLGHRLVRG